MTGQSMTGLEHYREAERILKQDKLDELLHMTEVEAQTHVMVAQVHATLALAYTQAMGHW